MKAWLTEEDIILHININEGYRNDHQDATQNTKCAAATPSLLVLMT